MSLVALFGLEKPEGTGKGGKGGGLVVYLREISVCPEVETRLTAPLRGVLYAANLIK